jgi:hypothetical protein
MAGAARNLIMAQSGHGLLCRAFAVGWESIVSVSSSSGFGSILISDLIDKVVRAVR